MKFKSAYLIALQAILFVVFLLITFFFNRFASDDYQFIGLLRDYSFQEVYGRLYYEWHGRWTSNFLLITLIKLNKIPLFLMGYNLFSVGLLYIGIVRLFKSLNTYYQLNLKKTTVLIYSIVFLSILFFCSISANDTWLWYTSSIVYLWSTIAFFFGIQLFFTQKKTLLGYLVFGISSIYIGGSNEALAILIVIALFYLLFKKTTPIISSTGIVLVCGAFLINYLSPGTVHRDEITPSMSLVNVLIYAGYGSVKFMFFTIYKTFIPAIILGIPFFLLGKTTPITTTTKFNPIKQLLVSIALINLIVFANQLLVVYAIGGMAPDRSTMVSTIAITILLIRYLFLLGNHLQDKYSVIKHIVWLNIVGLLIFNVYYFNIHKTYAIAVDKRNSYIKTCKSQLIQVDPLPNSGYIYSSEITGDPDNFKNQHLKNGLGIKKDIVMVIY